MTLHTFQGATVYLPGEIAQVNVTVFDGHIVEIDGPAQGDIIDAKGKTLAPALIDVHGDAFERQLMPRPGVFFPLEAAVIDTDRQLASNGIATAYHAVTLGWEPGLRDVARGRHMMQALLDLAPRLTVENRVQLRWETFALEALDVIEWALGAPFLPSIAFNDHTSMTMRGFDVAIQERAFEFSPAFSVADLNDPRMTARIAAKAHRSGLTNAEYVALLARVWERRSDVPAAIDRVADLGRKAGAPMLSHDDTRSETRSYFRALGARAAEFPMVMEAALAARDSGDLIIFGAPNAARGGSHIGSLSAGDMVESGLCDVLASDYFYPAMLAAVARLDADKRADRSAIWSLVSAGPARAMNLSDRGEIALGKRADLVLIDWPEGHAPSVLGTWVGGRCAYRGQSAG
ncbi:MAG: alpha-D-ribose 1-methylphosphonate 5-triphosphate diphosphatase [Alphaproteobacteria bacterium]|nr:alpha-D-ribose 1-methylphosphonate 5-triphosphate diphosphatase [Alphaproteobacteria bacterium]MBU1572633.1 alpha-D-ribose 1-methylphosphonate 5-triphosphate diphosphatase [Alphaproteobacteria bacterium]MBU2078605.1 alpha-D-ribose 1-methylphosphonate 5-triphosphate diphosphatase [Alphaproteobacteria bacterium]MBU2161013.1 alpha-D-ribose 1-methylphosphonate 5-triphosphate diphosphatase [Alphaproteobacteria bacterium]MBU2243994.1 alpha-D-ribose 1-methylphosphonate 5-triphosphate diphosphatase 